MPDFLDSEHLPAILTLGVVAGMFVLFVREVFPPAVTALAGAAALLVLGPLPGDRVLEVFANPAPWTIAAMFILSGGLVRTGALAYVTSERLISRTHFARFLIEAGHVRDMKDAFKRYLAAGRPGYVPHAWASLAQAVDWIHGAGGQAVIAHPGRYRLTPAGLRALTAEFRDLGGDALEVVSPSHTAAEYASLASIARSCGLGASCGSDFHGPGESRFDFGELPPLPVGVDPVWSDW